MEIVRLKSHEAYNAFAQTINKTANCKVNLEKTKKQVEDVIAASRAWGTNLADEWLAIQLACNIAERYHKGEQIEGTTELIENEQVYRFPWSLR